jgi:hypothetical protein
MIKIEESYFGDGYVIRFSPLSPWPITRTELEELRDEISRIFDTPEENFR